MGNFDPEKLKAWNMTSNQLKYMRQVVHNNNFVASFPLFYAAEWADYERQYFEAYGSAFSVYHFVQQTSYDCTDTIREFWLGGEPRENVCKIAKKIVTDVGVCWHIATGDVRGPREELDGLLVDVAMDDEYDGIAVEVHSANAPPNILSKALRVPAGQKLYTSLSIIKQQFLDRKNWGHCSDNIDESDGSLMHVPLDMESCVRRCKRVQFLEQCGCLPYSLYDDVSPECTVQQWYDCAHSNLRSLRKCPCTVECERILYKHSFTSYAQLATENSNVSSISISWKDSTSLEQTQQKRILTVDLLSWIAGYMGLFLGMSCITLLEIFVYLLKL
ncbi:FLR-1 protein, partial [Aphelenchoides avenae]